MRAGAAAVLAAAAALSVPGSPARACSCFEQSPSAYLAAANVVFTGEVRAFERDDAGAGVATVAVQTVYKGNAGPVARVESGSSGDTCGIGFVEGKAYLIFASLSDQALRTRLCSGTTDDVGFLARNGIPPISGSSTAVATAVATGAPQAMPRGPVEESRALPIVAALAAAVMAAAALVVFRPG